MNVITCCGWPRRNRKIIPLCHAAEDNISQDIPNKNKECSIKFSNLDAKR